MQKNKKNPEINIFLTTQLGLLKTLKETKIRFNPRPFSKKQEKTVNFDFDIDIIKKIDETINQNNTEQIRKLETTVASEEQKIDIPPEPIVEIREPWIKTPEPPQFTPIIQTEATITPQLNIQPPETKNENEKQDNINSTVFIGEKIKKTVSTLPRIRIRRKQNNTKTKNNNDLIKTKKELEKTITELEKKKKELEEMEQIAKQKEEELKKKEEERKKQEKLKKLEEKRKQKEAKKKEKERKRLEKQKQKELKKLEQKKLLEQKLREKEQLKKKKLEEKQKLLEELEKKKQIKKQKKETSEKKTLPFFKTIEKKETKTSETKEQNLQNWDEEVSQAITIIDNLLEQLPEETIDRFVQSEDFEIYERVVKKYKQNR